RRDRLALRPIAAPIHEHDENNRANDQHAGHHAAHGEEQRLGALFLVVFALAPRRFIQLVELIDLILRVAEAAAACRLDRHRPALAVLPPVLVVVRAAFAADGPRLAPALALALFA